MDGGAWWAAVHGVAKNRTQLSRLHFHALEKKMAIYSSVLAWKTSGTAESGGLPFTGGTKVTYQQYTLVWGIAG